MKAILLGAGRGSRLGALGRSTPKILVPLAGRPLLEHQLEALAHSGVESAVVTACVHHEQIERAANAWAGAPRLAVSVESALLGTAGGARRALELLDAADEEPVLIVYGDVVHQVDMAGLVASHRASGAQLTLSAYAAAETAGKGVIGTDGEGRVSGFREAAGSGPGLVNAGIYVIQAGLLRRVSLGPELDFGHDVIGHWIAEGVEVRCATLDQPVTDVGTPEMLALADGRAAPRVSVIVCCFNDGATLQATIDSVDAEVRHEIVLVDDGSTDPSTVALIDRLAGDPRITMVRQANGGLSSARRAGLRAAKGELIFPLDADDQLLPGALDALVAHLDAHPELAFAWGDLWTFGDLETIVRKADSLDPWMIQFVNELPVCSLIRREPLERYGPWRRRHGCEDWELWMSFAQAGLAGGRIDRPTVHFRLHGAGRLTAVYHARHDAIYRELLAAHPQLVARRRELRRSSPAPALLKAAVSVLDRLPVRRIYREGLILLAAGALRPGHRLAPVLRRLAAHSSLRMPRLRRTRRS